MQKTTVNFFKTTVTLPSISAFNTLVHFLECENAALSARAYFVKVCLRIRSLSPDQGAVLSPDWEVSPNREIVSEFNVCN